VTVGPLLRRCRFRRLSNRYGARSQRLSAVGRKPSAKFIHEYRPGAGIGWHRDRAQLDEVVGVSMLAPCAQRFRRKAGATWARPSLAVEPRSAYLLSGPGRTVWEHSIPALDRLSYSITLRTLVASKQSDASSAEGARVVALPDYAAALPASVASFTSFKLRSSS
jgi:2OG-Fe(II) oxygenase superfamily